jgi:signal transduction histidine kinase/ActR/RegA family two-component response regulator
MPLRRKSARSAAAPLDLGIDKPVIDRATFLASSLFGEPMAFVTLVEGDRAWRSFDQSVGRLSDHPIVQRIVETNRALWIRDASKDPEQADNPLVAGPSRIRFAAGAPILLKDGTTAGAILVMGRKPRALDKVKLACLERLADGLADEWARTKADRASLEAVQERDHARDRLVALIRGLPFSVVMTDRDLRIVAYSRAWSRVRRGSADEESVLGSDIFEVFNGFYNRFRDPFEKALNGERFEAQKLKVQGPNGPIYLQSDVKPWRNSAGEISGIIVAASNVTQMVQAFKAAERNEARLNMALGIADLHVFEIDYQNRRLIKGGAEESFFEEPLTYEGVFRDPMITVDERDRDRVREEWRRHAEEGAPYRTQYRTARSDGREVWVEATAEFKADAKGKPLTMLAALRNITEAKRQEQAVIRAKEEAEAANAAKSAFLATMSHEIRTPLNGVLGMAQVLAQDNLTPTQLQRVGVIQESGEALLAILNDLLDLAKIEAGKLTLEESRFDLEELARGAHASFSALAEQKDLRFGMTIAPEAQGAYIGDSTRVRQILYNLVSNALKFTEKGEVSVSIAAADKGFSMSVRDTGIGIQADRVERMFEKFEQADNSTTRRFGGTGLGLAICRELANLMGGEIRVESEQWVGSTFTVFLPLGRAAGQAPVEEPAEPASPQAPASEDAGQLRILVAEDNQVNQIVIKTLLQQAGVEPTIVGDGKAAVEALERTNWDLVLMDVQMPVMDGVAATLAIRRRERETGRVRTPILALTANAMTHQVAEYMASGMDGVIAKPINAAELFKSIEAALADVVPAEEEAAPRSAAG